MVGSAGPKYISPRSADVILSDIRPIKFNVEALGCLNALLDEILTSIIVAAHALTTERLKLGLLKVLPTTLGKEALLEAEVELRAYWERTNNARPGSAQTAVENQPDQDFNLQWAIELMRLKCEAYSTLNDSDEDPQAEARLNSRLGTPTARKAALVAPAALYLTAVLESICEHILSNVGRVATRDSSTTTASLQDLFVALCEDDSMFSLFRTMKVYDQVESLSKMSRTRRSNSVSRSGHSQRPSESLHQNHHGHAHTPSPVPDISSTASAASSRSRVSSDAPPLQNSGRTSLEKGRAIKLFKAHNRTSSDREQSQQELAPRASTADASRQSGQSDSFPSQLSVDGEDDESVEFDNRLRAGDTVKVSLTPDRLRTMDQEKNARAGKRQPSAKSPTERFPAAGDANGHSHAGAPANKTPTNRKTTFRDVESIVEYDEESKAKHSPNHGLTTPPGSRIRTNTGNHSPVTPGAVSPSASRNRSLSTSNASIVRKASTSIHQIQPPVPTPPSSVRQPRVPPKNADSAFGGPGSGGMPVRKRKIQRNLDDMDVDEIMNGSDEEEEQSATNASPAPSSTRPSTQLRSAAAGPKVSASTRELIDFLSEGPPPETMSSPTMPMHDDLHSSQSKSRGSGRLQRMMSKLSLGTGGDKTSMDGGSGRSIRRMPSQNAVSAPSTPSMRSQHSFSNLGPLPIAVKPTPPRMMPPPDTMITPISPPASPMRDPESRPQQFDSLRSRSRSVSHKHSLNPAAQPAAPAPNGTEFKAKASEAAEMVSMAEALRSRAPPPGSQRELSTSSSRLNGLPNGISKRKEVPYDQFSSRDSASNKAEAPSPVAPKPSSSRSHSRPESRSKSIRPASASSESTAAKIGQASSVKKAEAIAVSVSAQESVLTQEMALDMRRLLVNATNADECRLLVDMFLARAGIKVPSVFTASEQMDVAKAPVSPSTPSLKTTADSNPPSETDVSTQSDTHTTRSPTPPRTPTPTTATPTPTTASAVVTTTVNSDVKANPHPPLESSLVELFLGGDNIYPSLPASAKDSDNSTIIAITTSPTAPAAPTDDAVASDPMSPPITPAPSEESAIQSRANGNANAGADAGADAGVDGLQGMIEREKNAAARAQVMVTPLA